MYGPEVIVRKWLLGWYVMTFDVGWDASYSELELFDTWNEAIAYAVSVTRAC